MSRMGRRTWASIPAVTKSTEPISASDLPGVKPIVACRDGFGPPYSPWWATKKEVIVLHPQAAKTQCMTAQHNGPKSLKNRPRIEDKLLLQALLTLSSSGLLNRPTLDYLHQSQSSSHNNVAFTYRIQRGSQDIQFPGW